MCHKFFLYRKNRKKIKKIRFKSPGTMKSSFTFHFSIDLLRKIFQILFTNILKYNFPIIPSARLNVVYFQHIYHIVYRL